MIVAAALCRPRRLCRPSANRPQQQHLRNKRRFDRRAAQLVDLLAGKIAFADYFARLVPDRDPRATVQGDHRQPDRTIWPAAAMDTATSTDGRSGTVMLRFEKGVATIVLDVGTAADERVSGLRVTGFVVADDSFDRVAAELAALPGRTGFLVAELDGADVPSARLGQRRQAIRDRFDLQALYSRRTGGAGCGGQTEMVRRRPLVACQLFVGSDRQLAARHAGDAADARQLDDLGQRQWRRRHADPCARPRHDRSTNARAGHSDPSRNIPFLTTVEAFALKGNNFESERAAFVAGDDAAQRKLIDANQRRLTLGNVDGVSFAGGPRFIDSLEWFASPNDVCRLMIDLRSRNSPTAMSAMAINPGVNPGATKDWSWLGYKGGSELGVISMSLLGQRKSDGKWFVVTASWNNPDAPVATETMVGLVTRLLALAAK